MDSNALDTADQGQARKWLPLAIAALLVMTVVGASLFISKHPNSASPIAAVAAPADPYASSLPITGVAMSESSNLAGSKVTYVDGQIANTGDRTVTGIIVQVIFHSFTHEVAQSQTLPLSLIRTKEPYVDIESVGAAPILPGSHPEFRLIFDRVSSDWDGATPEIRIVRVNSK